MEKRQYINPRTEVTHLGSDVVMIISNPTSAGSLPPHPSNNIRHRWTDVF